MKSKVTKDTTSVDEDEPKNTESRFKAAKMKTESYFDEKYLNYFEKRPETVEVQLDPLIWCLVPSVGKNMDKLDKLVNYNSFLYNLSTLYTDIYFKNAKLNQYVEKKQKEWDAKDFSEYSLDKIDSEYNNYLASIKKEAEYMEIVEEMKIKKQEFKSKAKEIASDVLLESLKGYLNVKELKSIDRPDTINVKTFAQMIKNEANKAATILEQTYFTINGTILVTGKVSSVIILSTIELAEGTLQIAMDATTGALLYLWEGIEIVWDGTKWIAKETGEAIAAVTVPLAKLAKDEITTLTKNIGNQLAVAVKAGINV